VLATNKICRRSPIASSIVLIRVATSDRLAPDIPYNLFTMGKKSEVKESSLLYHRLKAALQDGIKVWFETRDKSYFGIPIGLDRDFVEVLILVPGSEDESTEYIFQRVTWVVRLASISAIAYPSEYWSTDRLDSLLNKSVMNTDI
jgi:hypothetical protein